MKEDRVMKEESKGMYLVDFCEVRNVKPNTVSAYINKHKDVFDGKVEREGKKMWLTDAAIDLLEKKYPLPQPIQMVQDPELVNSFRVLSEELNKVRKENAELVKNYWESQMALAESENQIKLLNAEMDNQIESHVQYRVEKAEEKHKKLCDAYDKTIKGYSERAEAAKEEKMKLENEIEKLKEALETEKKKSWIQKLFEKKS